MAGDHNISSYTLVDLERYHRGEMTLPERNALERAALEDPFLADALEAITDHRESVSPVSGDLQSRLRARLAGEERTAAAPVIPMTTDEPRAMLNERRLWLRIAALIILVAGAGLLIWQVGGDSANEGNQLAKQEITGNPTADTRRRDPSTGTHGEETPAIADSAGASNFGEQAAGSGIPPGNAPDNAPENAPDNTGEIAPAITPAHPVIDDRAELVTRNNALPPAPTVAAPATQKEAAADETKAGEGSAASGRLRKEKDEPVPGQASAVRRPSMAMARKANEMNRDSGDAFRSSRNDDLANRSAKTVKSPAGNYKVFRGLITDVQNKPLPFANVSNPIDQVGTYADANGYFILTSTDSLLQVQVRSVGFRPRMILLDEPGQTTRISMKEDDSTVNAVVLGARPVNAERKGASSMELEASEPIDGWRNYDLYLANNLNLPQGFGSRKPPSGEVELSFELDKNGEPANFVITRSLCSTCDQEAIRAVKQGPGWKRLASKGRTTVTVRF